MNLREAWRRTVVIRQFLDASSWQEAHAMVRSHADYLLTDIADVAISGLAERKGNKSSRSRFEERLSLLRLCREIGIDAGLARDAAHRAQGNGRVVASADAASAVLDSAWRGRTAAASSSATSSQARKKEAAVKDVVRKEETSAAPVRPRTFRVFVSSTFGDLAMERNVLRERTYPKLRELCAERGAGFQDIDLRWGVSEEASLDQQAMNICLEEIRRCREVTPRPNFLVLLGNRYGWRPLPPQIPEQEFTKILGRVPAEDKRELLTRWYQRDKNAVAVEYRLRPRVGDSAPTGHPREDDFADRAEWRQEEAAQWQEAQTRLREILSAATDGLELSEERRRIYESSATEQEIMAGALETGAPEGRAFCFTREINLKEGDPDPRQADAQDPILSFVDSDQRPLQELKQKLAGSDVAIRSYAAGWDAKRGAPTTDHLDRLADDVYAALKRAIELELTCPAEAPRAETYRTRTERHSQLDAEGEAHHEFADERIRFFVGREDLLRGIGGYLAASDPFPLVLHGGGGTGKSALIAKIARHAQDRPETQVVLRFIGATPASSDGHRLLLGICREIARRYGADEAAVPSDFQELSADFRERLGLASAERPLYLFIDSLDQLAGSDAARRLAWIPNQLPEHVRLVASTRPGDTLDPLVQRLKRAGQAEARLIEVGAMSRAEGDELLTLWLNDKGRSLQDSQRSVVLTAFEESGGNPLYLRLAFEEARHWISEKKPEKFASGVKGIIAKNTFARLADEDAHGQVLVSHALAYLAASRHGLAEQELVALLSRDQEVYRWFMLTSHHVPLDLRQRLGHYLRDDSKPELRAREEPERVDAVAEWMRQIRAGEREAKELDDFLNEVLVSPEGLQLPIVLWARLYSDLRPYLTTRAYENALLMGFYHRELGDVVREQYLSDAREPEYHAKLADYFRPGLEGNGRRKWSAGSLHGLSELPHHLTRAGEQRWDELYDALTDISFLEEKAQRVGRVTARDTEGKDVTTYTGVFQLQEDFDIALRAMSGGKEIGRRRIIVTATDFGDGLIVRCPHCNVPHPFEEKWRGQEITCPNEYCKAPLKVNGFVLERRDGNERPLRAMTSATGQASEERGIDPRGEVIEAYGRALRLEAHNLVGRPDRTWQQLYNRLQWEKKPVLDLLEAERARRSATLWLRTRMPVTESESLIRVFAAHTKRITACAVSADGSFFVSASEDGTVKVWDPETGAIRARLGGYADGVRGCAISPDSSFIVSAGPDKTLKLWDPESGAELMTLRGHAGRVVACAVSPDGSFVASMTEYGPLSLWDPESGAELARFGEHDGECLGLAISPDASFLVSGSGDSLRLWDAATGVERASLSGHNGKVTGCAVSPDGNFIVSASSDHTLKIWDAANGTERTTLFGHAGWVNACAVTPDGSVVVSASDDGTLKLWDPGTGTERATLRGHVHGVVACAVSPDGSSILSGAAGGRMRLWDAKTEDAETEAARPSPACHGGGIRGCAVSPDGSAIVSASEDGTLKLWDAENGAERTTLRGHSGGVRACAVSPDGSFVVSASNDRTLKLWDVRSGELRGTLRGHSDAVSGCAVSPEGAFVVSSSWDWTLRLWDVENGAERANFSTVAEPSLNACAVGPDGSFLVSAGDDGALTIWNPESRTEKMTLHGHSRGVRACAVSPDSSFLVSASSDETLKLWDVKSGAERATLRGHAGAVLGCAVSPDCSFVVSVSTDETLKVWDPQSGVELCTLALPSAPYCVAMHPSRPVASWGGTGGFIASIELVGVQYGSLIVTAADLGAGLVVRCPHCNAVHPFDDGWRGQEIRCPDESCKGQLKVNEFVVERTRG